MLEKWATKIYFQSIYDLVKYSFFCYKTTFKIPSKLTVSCFQIMWDDCSSLLFYVRELNRFLETRNPLTVLRAPRSLILDSFWYRESSFLSRLSTYF